MTRKEEIYNAMGDAEWKHIDGTKDIELFDMGFKEGAEWADAHTATFSVAMFAILIRMFVSATATPSARCYER